ncbi:MAG: hypothetical protein L3J72_04515, partial [Thermoplasmata archaeon]|nr:hypothetical protein [Thermoplasmata archaeon]
MAAGGRRRRRRSAQAASAAPTTITAPMIPYNSHVVEEVELPFALPPPEPPGEEEVTVTLAEAFAVA